MVQVDAIRREKAALKDTHARSAPALRTLEKEDLEKNRAGVE